MGRATRAALLAGGLPPAAGCGRGGLPGAGPSTADHWEFVDVDCRTAAVGGVAAGWSEGCAGTWLDETPDRRDESPKAQWLDHAAIRRKTLEQSKAEFFADGFVRKHGVPRQSVAEGFRSRHPLAAVVEDAIRRDIKPDGWRLAGRVGKEAKGAAAGEADPLRRYFAVRSFVMDHSSRWLDEAEGARAAVPAYRDRRREVRGD